MSRLPIPILLQVLRPQRFVGSPGYFCKLPRLIRGQPFSKQTHFFISFHANDGPEGCVVGLWDAAPPALRGPPPFTGTAARTRRMRTRGTIGRYIAIDKDESSKGTTTQAALRPFGPVL